MGEDQRSGAGLLEEFERLRARCDAFESSGTLPSAEDWQRLRELIGSAHDSQRLSIALRESNARLQAVIESLPFDFFLIDEDGRYAVQNSACRKNWGELLGTRPGDAAPNAEVRALWEENNRRAFAGEIVKGEVEYTHNGETRWYYNIISPILVADEVRGIMGINLDVTHEKRLSDEMQRSQKLDSLGVLAGGIAHDFNNLLMAIQGNISLAASRPDEPDAVTSQLVEAERGCERAKALSQRLLTFAKGGEPVREVSALGPLLVESADLAACGSNCRVELAIDESLWPANVDAGQIGQVFHNLVINAVQAMREGGTIRVSAANIDEEQAVGLGLEARRFVRVAVEDQGAGISEEHIDRLFDPYYTTRADGHGLGLAVVQSVVGRHGGTVRAERGRAEGARFEVFLPATDRLPADRNHLLKRGGSWSGRALVVDDEGPVRRVLSAMLAELGLTVTGAGSCAEAVARCEESLAGERFALIVLDLTLRGSTGGNACFARLRAIDPDARVIVTSGYSTDPALAEFRAHGYAAALPKPFSLPELQSAVAEALAGANR